MIETDDTMATADAMRIHLAETTATKPRWNPTTPIGQPEKAKRRTNCSAGKAGSDKLRLLSSHSSERCHQRRSADGGKVDGMKRAFTDFDNDIEKI